MDEAAPSVVRVTTCARQQLNSLLPWERHFIAAHLAQLSRYCAVQKAAPGPLLQSDRKERPPVIELRIWPFLVLYEHAAQHNAVTVLHVLRLPGQRPPAGEHVTAL